MSSSLSYPSINTCLGPPETRFFGGRFRLIDRELRDLSIDSSAVRATASVRYPDDWSRKHSGHPPPHLSSIDAGVFMVEMAEVYLADCLGLGPVQRATAWVRSVEMRVGTPQEDLAAFSVYADVSSAPVDGDPERCRTTLECQIGTLRGVCVVEHEHARRRAARRSYATTNDVLGSPRGRRGEQRTHAVEDVVLGPDRRWVHAAVTITDEGAELDSGLGSAYDPSVVLTDAVVVLAQMAQALTYDLDGIERARSETFWLRRLAMSRDTPLAPIDRQLAASLSVTHTRRLRLAGNEWRTLVVDGQIAGIRIQGAVAHQLPAGLAGTDGHDSNENGDSDE